MVRIIDKTGVSISWKREGFGGYDSKLYISTHAVKSLFEIRQSVFNLMFLF